eukprot:TRINITY_DN63194_c0_g1_i1.p1 TRINITY_DN63194_c0_g1~~TRINITY_DN63194_c0_g1_i1.p1  ORF type:complete len:221 (-),score=42.35 TRINITY_DN63194_c0_g1_i1:24-641(-)
MEELREIGDEAAWSLSSAKQGNGVEQLRDGNVETFWQSDGPQPHLINIQFQRKVKVSELRIHTSYKIDESYTPASISIRLGTAQHDLQEVQLVELKEPDGWIHVHLAKPSTKRTETPASCTLRDPEMGGAVDYVRTHFIQLAVLTNHQNGRDTHIRQLQVHGPRSSPGPGLGQCLASARGASRASAEACQIKLQTRELQQFASIR